MDAKRDFRSAEMPWLDELDRQRALIRLTRLAGRSLQAQGACLTLLDEAEPRVAARWCIDRDSVRAHRDTLRMALRSGAFEVVDDAPLPPTGVSAPGTTIRSAASAPLHGPRGQLIGCLTVTDDRPRAFDDDARRDLMELAYLASQLIDRSAARSVDPQTGLHDRRLLFDQLALEIRRCRRQVRPISVLAVGLGGDRRSAALNGVPILARLLRQQLLRAGDLAARFDGNEVVCVLPGADAGEARRFANRLQKRWIIATGAARWRLDLGISTLRAEDTAELWQVAGLLTRALHQMELAAHQRRGEPLEHRRPSAA